MTPHLIRDPLSLQWRESGFREIKKLPPRTKVIQSQATLSPCLVLRVKAFPHGRGWGRLLALLLRVTEDSSLQRLPASLPGGRAATWFMCTEGAAGPLQGSSRQKHLGMFFLSLNFQFACKGAHFWNKGQSGH